MKHRAVTYLSIGILLVLFAHKSLRAQQAEYVSKVWVADNGDGTYKNPVLHADYSDPDVVRVGEYYYMTASSFNSGLYETLANKHILNALVFIISINSLLFNSIH